MYLVTPPALSPPLSLSFTLQPGLALTPDILLLVSNPTRTLVLKVGVCDLWSEVEPSQNKRKRARDLISS